MSKGTELVMLLRGRAPLAVAMTASARPNKVLTPRTTVARSKSGVFGRNIMYFIRGVSDHPIDARLGIRPRPRKLLFGRPVLYSNGADVERIDCMQSTVTYVLKMHTVRAA